jgi:hypothetical protein
MNKLMTASINLSKIDKTKIVEGKSGKWIDLVIWFNEEPDQYGNNFSIQQKVEMGGSKIYLGNGKFYIPKEKPEEPAQKKQPDNDDDMPF